MNLLKYSLKFLAIGFLLEFAVAREPLVNNQGRFAFVDNIRTISVNGSIPFDRSSLELVRRDPGEGGLCRGKCDGAALRERGLHKRSSDNDGFFKGLWHFITKSLRKRVFDEFATITQEGMDAWMVNRFANPVRGFEWVFDPDVLNGRHRDENTARFTTLGDRRVEMGLAGLCGCSILVVMSRRAVYFAHFFENLSWRPDDWVLEDRGITDLEQNFRISVLDFLDTGRDWPGEDVNQNPSLSRHARAFQPNSHPRAFILTPQREGNGGADGESHYLPGLYFEHMVGLLAQKVFEVLPGIPLDIYSYQAVDGRNSLHDRTGRGKALFQYDPAALDGGYRGARLIFQGGDVDIHGFGGERIHRGVVYSPYWHPNEARLLSLPGWQGPGAAEDSLLPCGAQFYEDSQYTCYNATLCPVVDGVRTQICGAQCYLESVYTCYETMLCPVQNGVATLPCGGDCYLPSEYRCETSHLIPILPPDGDFHQHTRSAITTSSSPGTQGGQFIFNGTTYPIGTQPITIMDHGQTVFLGPNGLVIGTDTISIPASQTVPMAITTDGVTFTFVPKPSGSGSSSATESNFPSSSGPSNSDVSPPSSVPTSAVPGPTPTSVIPRSTTNPVPVPPGPTNTDISTVVTITAFDGSSTMEATFTPTTFEQFATLTDTTTVTTITHGVPTTLVIAPGGIAWGPVNTDTSAPSGFPPIPFPTLPPAPQSSHVFPPETSSGSSSTVNPFPSSQFTIPPLITTVITTDSTGSPIITTITGTTDANGIVVPVTTLSTAAAVSSAEALVSRLDSVSDAIVALSSSPANPASASSAVAAIETAKSDTDSFGIGLGFSLPGLCFIFCGSVGGAASILDSLTNIVSSIIGGTAGPGSLTAPLAYLINIADELAEDVWEAGNDPSATTFHPQPTVTSSNTASPSCTGTPVVNCDVFCEVVSRPTVEERTRPQLHMTMSTVPHPTPTLECLCTHMRDIRGFRPRQRLRVIATLALRQWQQPRPYLPQPSHHQQQPSRQQRVNRQQRPPRVQPLVRRLRQ
ncbi:hypothetical protein FQN50_006059 [Emmonsiellopsis sp. PD_5]|nr:hypothetical protein FQN50_006059 [Emmonsiellopsis sp. PD_5]